MIKKKNDTKHTINLCRMELVSSTFPKKAMSLIILIIVFIVFLWFGVIERYIEINSLDGILIEKKSELEIIKNRCNELNFDKEDYLRYSKDYLSSKERDIVSRVVAFEKIDKYLIGTCDVAKLQLDGNELITTLYGTTLAESSIVIDKMLHDEDDAIEYAKTKNAKQDSISKSTLDMTVVFAGINDKEISFEE